MYVQNPILCKKTITKLNALAEVMQFQLRYFQQQAIGEQLNTSLTSQKFQ